MLSFTSPGPQAFEAADAIPLAKDANDRLFEAVKRHPDRFAGFAALPTAAPDAAADELERAVTKLGFKGTMIHGHTRGSFLDEKKYWVIFERAQALGVPIYLHPALPHPDVVKAYFTGYEDLARAAWGFAVDTSVHFLRLVFAGVFDAYPDLKIILGHLGEGLPFAMHRLNDHTFAAAKRRGLKKTPLQYLQDNMLVTTSGNWFEPAFVCTLAGARGGQHPLRHRLAIRAQHDRNPFPQDRCRSATSTGKRSRISMRNACCAYKRRPGLSAPGSASSPPSRIAAAPTANSRWYEPVRANR